MIYWPEDFSGLIFCHHVCIVSNMWHIQHSKYLFNFKCCTALNNTENQNDKKHLKCKS